jgi:hypothetical protein
MRLLFACIFTLRNIDRKQVAIYWKWLREANDVAQGISSDQLQASVQKLSQEFYALGSAALDAMRYQLEVRKNGRIGHQLLREIGVIPSPAERIAIAAKPSTIDKSTLAPFELAVAEDEHGQINRVAYGMAYAMEESARIYGTPLPTAEEYRRLRRIAKVADELSGGTFSRGMPSRRSRGEAHSPVSGGGAGA